MPKQIHDAHSGREGTACIVATAPVGRQVTLGGRVIGMSGGYVEVATQRKGKWVVLGLSPIGATGSILTVKAIYELQRTGGRYGLVTMCIGGGQGIAAVFERL